MRKLALFAAILVAPPLAAQTEEASWLTDFEAAVAAAKATGKPILANFTGSDWCGWCIKLKREVFAMPEFAAWAAEQVVLLELDYPKRTEQAEELRRQNQRLKQRYQITGYPTLLLLDAEGKRLGQLGYVAGGPKAWLAKADAALQGKAAVAATAPAEVRDEASMTGWSVNLAAAQAQAAREQKAVLLACTGSDWCSTSKRLRSEVLQQPAFLEWAGNKVVLVEVDFPRRSKQSPALKEQNQALAGRLGVAAYPELLLLDASGAKLGSLELGDGALATVTAAADQLLQRKTDK